MSDRCIFCGCESANVNPFIPFANMVECPSCGRVVYLYDELGSQPDFPRNMDKLAAYLFYNAKKDVKIDRSQYYANFVGFSNDFESYKEGTVRLFHVTDEIVENWYPKSFDDRINKILLYLSNASNNVGERITFSKEDVNGCFFISRFGKDGKRELTQKERHDQVSTMKQYLVDNKIIDKVGFSGDGGMVCILAPAGWQRVERLKENLYNLSKTPRIRIEDELKNGISTEYLDGQLDIMLEMCDKSPLDAIGKAKELIETICKTVLLEIGIQPDDDWKIHQLVKETLKHLDLTPESIQKDDGLADDLKKMLGSLSSITSSVADLRNSYGSGHGKPSSFMGLEKRHARLAVNSSIAFATFVWETYKGRTINQLG